MPIEHNFSEKEELERQIEARLKIEKQPERKPEFLSEEEKKEREKIEKKIEKVELPVKEEERLKKEAKEIEKMALPGKVSRLFEIALEEGLFSALKIAEATGDGYLIDVFHDLLAKNSFYKKFIK